MRIQVFTAIAFTAASVEGAHLRAFPSPGLDEIEQMEFMQTFDEEAFAAKMYSLSQYDSQAYFDTDAYVQTLSNSKAEVFAALTADIKAHG